MCKKRVEISVRNIQLLKMLKYVLVANFIFLYLGIVFSFSCEDDLYRDCSARVAQGGCEVSRGSYYVLIL